jgi:diguanylate cyclase (GGDEF)-like protein
MFELLKIGVIHAGRPPHLCKDSALENAPWEVEHIHTGEILGIPASQRPSFLAVFFPLDDAPPATPIQLANIFPGAEIIGYQNSEKSSFENLSRRDDGILIVHLPMCYAIAKHLLEGIAINKANRQEMQFVRSRSDGLQEFFETFVNAIESSWSIDDRKLGMNLFISRILDRLQAEECALYLFDEGRAALHRAYSTGNIRDIDLFDYQANKSIVENALNTGTPYINNNYKFEIRVPFSSNSIMIRSILCLPLEHRGTRLGVIELLNKTNATFTEEDRTTLEALINPLTVAIRTIEMFEGSERLTITDDLTRLYNYRYLMQFLAAEVKRCLRYKKKVSLLFVDIDGFKRINDTFGHLVGSQALSELGQVFRRILRETDIVGRYGGDEFVIVLPETPLNGAMVIAERIRKKVEDYEFVAQNLGIRLTVSLGVANCPKHTLTAEGLIKKADAAMYRAKELSRNSIKVAV